MPDSQNNINNTKTTVLSITSPVLDDKTPIPTICINIDERNKNTIGLVQSTKAGILQCLPEIFNDIDIRRSNSINNNLNNAIVKGDFYKPYIFGKCNHHTSYIISNNRVLCRILSPSLGIWNFSILLRDRTNAKHEKYFYHLPLPTSEKRQIPLISKFLSYFPTEHLSSI